MASEWALSLFLSNTTAVFDSSGRRSYQFTALSLSNVHCEASESEQNSFVKNVKIVTCLRMR